MSRRLRSPSVRALLEALDRCVLTLNEGEMFWTIDGKQLAIGGCSKDRQACYGRAVGGKAKGYKSHALVGSSGGLARLPAPMNKDERTMAKRRVRRTQVPGCVVGDATDDSNPLHDVCAALGILQLVALRRYGAGKGIGHRRHRQGRRRSVALLENPTPRFGESLLNDRVEIERQFGRWCNGAGRRRAYRRGSGPIAASDDGSRSNSS